MRLLLASYLALEVVALCACGDDARVSDAGVSDAAVADAGATDAGTADGGSTDDAGADAGSTDAGPASDTWSTFAKDFFATYCVECHAGPPSGRDFRTIDDVRRDAMLSRCGVAPSGETQPGCAASPAAGMFPVGAGPSPSDEDRRRIVAWIDAGLPE